ncbi:MAG: hypothetical protein AB7P17_11785 [Nitrospirales bacterium]|nr:hypothetical protein [Nitrospirales bacterium]
MNQRRQEILQRLKEEEPSVRFLRLRMALAVLIFFIIFAVCAPLMIVFCILLYGFFSEGIYFVSEIIATNGQVLEGMWPMEVFFLFLVGSGILGMGLAFISGYWIIINFRLLSPDQVSDLNARLNKAGI